MISSKPQLKDALAARMRGQDPAAQARPHTPADPQPQRGGQARGRERRHRGLGLARWVRQAPAERTPIVLGVGVYGAGWLSHAAHWSTVGLIMGSVGAAAVAYLWRIRKIGGESRAAKTAAAIGASGLWTAITTQISPAEGPYGAFTWAYAAGFGIAYYLYRQDEHVRDAIRWRAAKTNWHILAARFDLRGSHLLRVEDTRLGEKLLIDVTGTGRRASALASGDLAERIAEYHGLPRQRVRVREDRIAGRIWISIRHTDPWEQPIPHPLLDQDPEIVLPEVGDARGPQILGIDPETGRPLTLTLCDEDGAVNTLIVAMQRSGKTVLLSDLLERLTAARNAFVVGINVSKAKEMYRWRRALGLSACGPQERVRALRILEQVNRAIERRGADRGDETVFTPRPGRPLIVVVIDEMDKLLAANDNIGMALRQAVGDIVSKGGSEGACAVLVGQRGTQSYIGDTDIRTQIRNYVFLQLAGSGEAMNAMGEVGLTLPDMSRYGEGHKGVAVAATLDGDYEIGRSFNLKELVDIDRVTNGRRPCDLERDLVEFLGEPFARLMATEPGADAGWVAAHVADDEKPAEGTTAADALESAMEQPGEIRKAQATIDEAAAYLQHVEELPPVDEETARRIAEAAQERRGEAAGQTDMSDDVRAMIVGLLGDGTTVRQVADALEAHGVSRMGAWRCLDRLRHDGVARMVGRGRGASWHLADPSGGGEEGTGDVHAA